MIHCQIEIYLTIINESLGIYLECEDLRELVKLSHFTE